ncbi:MAG: GNAT family N-acetyltransferase [Chryseobacterium sp.]|nr:GNAT family N-acetyltransferase [Candidatus Chryseobacterium enterohippi]
MKNTRKAETKDLEMLSQLFDEYRIFYHKESNINDAQVFLNERIAQQDSEIIVVEENQILVGFVQLYPLFSSTRMKKYWLLNDLFVNENHRGKGYSKQLIGSAKKICKESDACGILLETGKDNLIGNQLYPSCGFKIYDEVNFYEWTSV